MYMNYVGMRLNTEDLKEFNWKVKKNWNSILGALLGVSLPESLHVLLKKGQLRKQVKIVQKK